MATLCTRPEVIEHGSTTTSPWLDQLESVSSLHKLQLQLLQIATQDDQLHWLVPPEALRAALDISFPQNQILLDLLSSITDDLHPAAATMPDTPPPIDCHRLVLLLCVHHYIREAARAETADAWPDPNTMLIEPSSPNRMTARAWGKDQGDRHDQSHHAHLPMIRQQAQEHLRYQEALLQNFTPFVVAHVKELVAIAAASPRVQDEMISAVEVDRLGFLLHGVKDDNKPRGEEGEGDSPMDVCSTPFDTGPNFRLSEKLSIFQGAAAESRFSIEKVAKCIETGLQSQEEEDIAPETQSPDRTMVFAGQSPPRTSAFDALTPSLLLTHPGDVHGVHKATILRGEADIPTSGRLRITDCHDAVIYCLAPLQYVMLSACSDCIVVVGAVARAMRVERCERVQVVVAAKQVAVNTCHDSTLYLGVARPPLLLGDNRFVKLAPHNTSYERLSQHLTLAGLDPSVNLWSSPLTLTPDHSKHHHQPLHHNTNNTNANNLHHHDLSTATDGAPPAVALLPPDKLHLMLVPFRGTDGPLCGGPAAPEPGISTGNDGLNTWLALSADAGRPATGPYGLPPAYAAAWEEKLKAAAEVRQAVRGANLDEGAKRDLMTAVQSHFKEWLQTTGAMREVYELAKVEKEARMLQQTQTPTSSQGNSTSL